LKIREHSQSIATQNDLMVLSLSNPFRRSDGSEFRTIRCMFDQHAVLSVDWFREGSLLSITLTPEGKLVNIVPKY
jgi:hypothetical protein